ncbi:hypothetical protein Tco_0505822 [Tanacetum coccineum]
MFLNMDQLQKQLDNNEFQEIGSMASFKVLETQFQMFIKSKIYLNDEYIVMTRNYFLQYTQLDIPEFRETLVQFMEYVKTSIDERALHKREHDSRVNERLMQTTEEKVDSSKALDASLVIIESNGTESQEQDTSSRSGNDAHVDDADIRPIYNEEPMAEVDQNAEQCHDIRPLPAKLTDNMTTELSDQSLESENVCLKKTVAQFQKDFSRMEAHCVNLELKYQNQVLKEGQQGQFLNVKSNEAKVKNDIDVTETINIELEHKVAKLLMENETLKRHYKEMFDSIKTTRAKNIEHTTSLIANNDKFKAQIQEKGFAVAALKNELRKLTGNSVNTKFAKPSILGKPVGQPLKNQSVVRQPTAFKSERPRISKPRFASQVDVNNNLLKPVTTHYLPKRRESAPAKPHHMIAPSSSSSFFAVKITLQAPFLNVQKTFDRSRSSLGYSMADDNSEFKTTAMNTVSSKLFQKLFLKKQDSNPSRHRVGITISTCTRTAEDKQVVRLGINPMIQPEPEDLPKDNPKLEIAVLRWQFCSKPPSTKIQTALIDLEQEIK